MWRSDCLARGMRPSAATSSVFLHGAAVLGLFTLFRADMVRPRPPATAHTLTYWKPAAPDPNRPGGGGQRETLPASRGKLPRRAQRTLMPLTLHALNDQPRLSVRQAILLEPDVPLTHVNVDRLGSPFGIDGPLSGGRGGPGGVGESGCCGVGNSSGDGVQGSSRPTPLRTGAQFRPPVLLYKTEPEYSEEARKAKVQGVVILAAEVDENGRLRNIRVTRPLGLGLDERALGAVAQWRFRPATANGRFVPHSVSIEVNFRLL